MPELINIEQHKRILLRRFLRKKMLFYIFPNIIFNTCIPYFSFTNRHAVHLFEGEQNLARFLLPMSLFLPFIITFDILKKTMKLSAQENIDIFIDKNINKNKIIFQMAAGNGICAALITLFLLFCLYFSFPRHYNFNGAVMAVVVGLLAGLFSLIFTYLPVKKLQNLNKK